MPNCAVKGCKSWNMREDFEKSIRFFSFPKDPEVKELWIRACNKPIVNWQNARMCSLHFTDGDWCLKDKLLNTAKAKCSLDKRAVPSRNLPVEIPELKPKPMNKIRFDNRVKPKNVLALNEKVAAIRRFEVDPVYKSVGRYFNCSPDQIKRIIKQKDCILSEWDNRTKKSQVNLSREMKTVKISFLGKAVHEWIRRMMYYSDFNLTDALIQTMAIEFKKALNLPNFFPDKGWVTSFRNTYNLKDVSTKTLGIGYSESQSVQIRDILRYLQGICGSNETEEGCNDNSTHDMEDSKPFPSAVLENEEPKHCLPQSNPASSVKYSCKPSTSTAALSRGSQTTATPSTKTQSLKVETEQVDVVSIKMETDNDIITHEEAINIVKQLEDFALLKENFRLIGLVERLEKALKEQS